MSEQQEQEHTGTAPDPNAGTPEKTAFEEDAGATGTAGTPTTETVETDEQKNARLAQTAETRSQRRRDTLNSRINELTAERYAEKARADALERRVGELTERFMQQGSAPAPTQGGEPRRDQFQDYETYLEARAEWRAANLVRGVLQESSSRNAQATQANVAAQQIGAMQRNIKGSITEFVKAHPDYHDVIESHDVDIPPPATLAIGTHKEAAAIMYHLGQNPDLAESLQTMSPVEQIATIGEIAASVRSSPRVSKAPAPGQPVGSKPGSSSEPPEDTAAYMAWAEKHMR